MKFLLVASSKRGAVGCEENVPWFRLSGDNIMDR